MKYQDFLARLNEVRPTQRWGQAAWNILSGVFVLDDLHGTVHDPFYTVDDEHDMWTWILTWFDIEADGKMLRKPLRVALDGSIVAI
jgi:hypothetical protein